MYGSVGSGKTTAAVRLAKKYKIEHVSLDNVVYENTDFDQRKRTLEEQVAIIKEVIAQSGWIVEGAQFREEFYLPLATAADYIVILDPPSHKVRMRIVGCFCKQKMKMEDSTYIPSISMLKQMLQWEHAFQENKHEHIKKLKQFGKVISISDIELLQMLETQGK